MIICFWLMFLVQLCKGSSNHVLMNEIESKAQQRMVRHPSTPLSFTQGCPQTAYRFPYANRAEEYIRTKQPIPGLTEFTFCFRFTKSRHEMDNILNYGSDISSQYINDYLLRFFHDEMCIFVNNVAKCVEAKFVTSTTYHVCVATHASKDIGRSHVFVNSVLRHIVHHEKPGTIPGDGILVIGTNHEDLGSGYASKNFYQGVLRNFMMWNRILNQGEVDKLYRDPCYCAPGHFLSPTPDNVQMYGGVSAMMVKQC